MAVIEKHGTKPSQKAPYTKTFTCGSCGCRFTPEYGRDFPAHKNGGYGIYEESWWELPCPETFCSGTGKAYESYGR